MTKEFLMVKILRVRAQLDWSMITSMDLLLIRLIPKPLLYLLPDRPGRHILLKARIH